MHTYSTWYSVFQNEHCTITEFTLQIIGKYVHMFTYINIYVYMYVAISACIRRASTRMGLHIHLNQMDPL